MKKKVNKENMEEIIRVFEEIKTMYLMNLEIISFGKMKRPLVFHLLEKNVQNSSSIRSQRVFGQFFATSSHVRSSQQFEWLSIC